MENTNTNTTNEKVAMIRYFEAPAVKIPAKDKEGNEVFLEKGIVGGTLIEVDAKVIDDDGQSSIIEVDTYDEFGYERLDGLEALILKFYNPDEEYGNTSVWINKSKNKKKGDLLGDILDIKPKTGRNFYLRGQWSEETEEYPRRFWPRGLKRMTQRTEFMDSNKDKVWATELVSAIWYKDATTTGKGKTYPASVSIMTSAPLSKNKGEYDTVFITVPTAVLAANGIVPEDLRKGPDGCKKAAITILDDGLEIDVDKNENVKSMKIKPDAKVVIQLLEQDIVDVIEETAPVEAEAAAE